MAAGVWGVLFFLEGCRPLSSAGLGDALFDLFVFHIVSVSGLVVALVGLATRRAGSWPALAAGLLVLGGFWSWVLLFAPC